MSISQGATDIIGGGGYGFGGGFGGVPAIGLFGVANGLFGRGFGNDGFGRDGLAGTTVAEQGISDLKRDVQGTSTEVHKLGNEVAGMFAQQNQTFQGEFRNIDNQVCALDKTVMQGNFALSNQMSNFQHSMDNQFCRIENAIHADGDSTRALINSI